MERRSHQAAPEVLLMALVEENSKLSPLTWIAIVLTVIGALNWGLIGLLNLDLVATLFGHQSILSRIVYGLVGLAGLYLIVDAGRLRETHRHRTVAVT